MPSDAIDAGYGMFPMDIETDILGDVIGASANKIDIIAAVIIADIIRHINSIAINKIKIDQATVSEARTKRPPLVNVVQHDRNLGIGKAKPLG